MNENVEEQIQKARALVKNGEIEAALEISKDLLIANPKNALCYKTRAYIYYRMGDSKNTFKNLDLAISLEPEEPAYWFYKGYWKINFQSYEEGEEALTRAIFEENKLHDSYYLKTAYFLRAFARQQIGKNDDAQNDLDNLDDEIQMYINGKIRSSSSLRTS